MTPVSVLRRPSKPSILIIADDLSGAADSAVACVEKGLEAVVALDDEAPSHVDAVAFDADTRGRSEEAAAAENARIVGARDGYGVLFKKVDSTLRGHIGAEIAAILSVQRRMAQAKRTSRTIAILAPAFPALGRTTLSGRQYLDGRPLDETEVWRREGLSKRASLPEMLGVAGLTSEVVPLEILRRGEEAATAVMARRRDHVDVLICDAETDEDLASATRAALAVRGDQIWVGSAGLAGHVVDAAGLARSGAPFAGHTPNRGALLFVVGSLSAVSRRQASLLRAEGLASFVIDTKMLADPAALADLSGRFSAAFAGSEDVLLQSAVEDPSSSDAAPLREAMAALIAPHAARLGGLFVTGGEIARAVLSGLGVRTLRPIVEVERGVPLSVTGGPLSLPVITKAGAFGEATTMLNCRRVLRRFGLVDQSLAPAQEVRR